MTPEVIATICETIMVICFGVSWPLSIYKSATSKSTKGKSPYFIMAIITGYVAIIIGKIVLNEFTFWLDILKFVLYIVNLCMVSTDLALYFRNRKLEKAAESQKKQSVEVNPIQFTKNKKHNKTSYGIIEPQEVFNYG